MLKKQVICVLLLLLVLLVLLSSQHAVISSEQTISYTSASTEPICTASGDQSYPQISGNNVVWWEWTTVEWGGGEVASYSFYLLKYLAAKSERIYFKGYNLSTQKEFDVGQRDTWPFGEPIHVSENRVVHMGISGSDVWSYNLLTEASFKISDSNTIAPLLETSPNYLVFRKYSQDSIKLCGFDFENWDEFLIHTGNIWEADIEGNRVVYAVENENSGYDIYLAEITQSEVPIPTQPKIISSLTVEPSQFDPYEQDHVDIKYNLERESLVTIEILDPGGKSVKTLINDKEMPANTDSEPHVESWCGVIDCPEIANQDIENDEGVLIAPNGAYSIKITAKDVSDSSITDTEEVDIKVKSAW